ncbi:MAG: D-alanyl-D-alanine carboxypeptidase [Muribaculum sp.]|nr:D-alanyl-D-alanine carboxypeptidase [Muribaculum sp.]
MRKNHRVHMARLIGGLFCAFLVMNAMRGTVLADEVQGQELSLYATAAVLLDADSGRVLYEKEGDTPMAMASTTKIMTCILVLEQGKLDDMAQVSAYAASMPKVKLYAKQGEEYQVRSLLFSLMLESHNDTAVVLAEYIGKRYLSEELAGKNTSEYTVEESKQAVKAFAGLMNAKAAELGCENTWFITPNGLDATETLENAAGESVEREHCTTAAELARIMAYCVKESPGRDVFREITRTQSYSFYENGRNVTCVNHNAFLGMMDGAFSGKTGFTNKAGYCYVGALERDGKTLIVALLACGWPNNKTYKWSDTRELMEYGLANYQYREFLGEETAYDEGRLRALPVEDGQTSVLGGTALVDLEIMERHDGSGGHADNSQEDEECKGLLLREDEEIKVECELRNSLQAPVLSGTPVGQISYSVDGRVYLTETIVTKGGVERVELPWCVEQVFGRFLIL